MTAPEPGHVTRIDDWAVANRDGELKAVSRRCRHQLGDLSAGTVDADGCLVCPWHQSRYDLDTGEMVEGPKGFLGYHGPSRGYSGLIKAFGRVAKLRVRPVSVDAQGTLHVDT